jgi:hypothetical protein
MANIIRHEKCHRVYSGEEFNAPVILCHCGREVLCTGFTNTCECGADYNSLGQRLAPREQWGYETDESSADIPRIP